MTVETQRLMAFLDGGSRRPLACIDNLAVSPPLHSTLALKGDVSDINPVDRFLEDLVKFWGENAPVTDIFESTAVNVEYNDVRTFTNIVTEVSHAAANSGTLYDVVDELLWPYNSRPESYLAKSRIDREANLFKGDSAADEELFQELFPGDQCPKLRTFILSGVILSPTEYYFCRRKEKQLIDLDEDEGKSGKSSADYVKLESESAVDKAARKIYEDFQWYKVSKTFTDEGIEVPSAVEVADPHEVTAGAKTGSVDFGSQEAILLYATLENAWNTDAHGGYELSPELKEFIERDRRSLLATLREQEAATAAVAAATSTPSAGSTLPENIATPDSLLSGTTAGSGTIQGGQRFAPQSDSKLGEVNIRASPAVISNTPPYSATVVPGAASMISVKELPDTANHDDDDDEYISSSDSYSRAGEEVTNGVVNGADAMELDFAGLKKT
ncbi:hypothetical protein D0Z00_003644 [Geotrichum galactomycetum]|uniref:Uncharacterized protein n=1 Tax=Geotrichum galactomycetum TaxID=27317 RepID=A0ACB6V0S6_9ASCO|nr:hypothetical protein D0Z00_003644 [Geotrichum candidum]